MEASLINVLKTHDSVFSYTCKACNKCCHGKGIQVNPYESLRLSNHLNVSTTYFRSTYLNGQFLKHKPNSNACVFLGDNGCTVHKDRPLVCRLYPLGRMSLEDEEDHFTNLKPHSDSAGVYGEESTVGGYLESQEIIPYVHAESAYKRLIQRMTKVAFVNAPSKSEKKSPIGETKFDYLPWVLDPHPIIKEYCKMKNCSIPERVEGQLSCHIEALEAWVDGEWDPVLNF